MNRKLIRNRSMHNGLLNVYDMVSGELTQEKVNELYRRSSEVSQLVSSGNFSTTIADYDEFFCGYAFGDMWLLIETIEELERQLGLSEANKQMLSEAENNSVFFENISVYNYHLNQLILESYCDRSITSFYFTPYAFSLFEYNFSAMLILLFLLFIAIPMFNGERESDMLIVLLSTKRGYLRHGIMLNKIVTLIFSITVLVVVFSIADFVCLRFNLGFNGLSQPLFVLKEFQYTPTSMSILSFWFLTVFYKWFGFVCVGMLLLLISKITPNQMVGFISGLSLIVGLMSLCAFLNDGIWNMLNFFNPISYLIGYRYHFYFRTIALGDTPLLETRFLCIAGIALFISLFLFVYLTPFSVTFKSTKRRSKAI